MQLLARLLRPEGGIRRLVEQSPRVTDPEVKITKDDGTCFLITLPAPSASLRD